MDLTEDLFDDIDAWLNNRMNPTEQEAFRQRLAQDAELRQEVEVQRRIQQGLEATAMKRQLGTMRKGIGRERRLRRVARSVVAVMLVGIFFTGGLDLYQYSGVMTLSGQPETPTRDDSALPAGVQPAVDAYYEGQYAEAQRLLAPLSTDSLRLVPYYRGLTSLGLDRPDDALKDLAQARQSVDRTTRQKADWYTAMAHLQAHNFKEARQILESIRNDNAHRYRASAAEVLDKLPWWL